MKKTNAGNVGGALQTNDVKTVYPVSTAKINPNNTIQKQRIADVTLYRSGSSGRVLFAESERTQ